MRKIGSEKELESKRNRTVSIISVLLLGILVVGTVGYGFIYGPGFSDKEEEQQITEITSYGDRWLVPFNDKIFSLSYNLDEVQEISVDSSQTLEDYSGKQVYLASENSGIASEIASVVGVYASQIQLACYGSCEADLPEKTCEDNLIVWRDTSENKVYQEQNCIFIEGDLRTADAFIYDLLEMKDQSI